MLKIEESEDEEKFLQSPTDMTEGKICSWTQTWKHKALSEGSPAFPLGSGISTKDYTTLH